MTTILTTPLRDQPLKQTVRINSEIRQIIACISPYLLFNGDPSGTILFKIKKNAITVFSHTIDLSTIKTMVGTANGYIHLFYPVIPFTPLLLEKGLYDLVLEAGTYAYSNSSFVGWNTQHEDVQIPMEYVPTDDSENPLTVRVKVIKEGLIT